MVFACISLILYACINTGVAESTELGYFWHLTDMHLDVNYTHRSNCDLGRLGDYRCDSPLDLVKSAISAARRLSAGKAVDFVVWNGDNTDHQPVDAERLERSVRLVSQELRTQFTRDVYVLPTVGNHDVAPSNSMSPMAGSRERTRWCNQLVSDPELWRKWIQSQTGAGGPPAFNFSEGCFHSHLLTSPTNRSLLLVGLNGLIWYQNNPLSDASLADPLGQLDWLNRTFQWARRAAVKVLVVSHFPPGASENAPRRFRFLHEHFNRRFISLLKSNADLIMAGLFAHEHVDSFRVLSTDQGKPLVSLFVSPSVSPMRLLGLGSFNPRIRLYSFRRSDYHLVGYQQYYLNLSSQSTGDSAPDWQLEYASNDEYQLKDLSPASLNGLLSTFEYDNDSSPTGFWSRYWSHELGQRNHEANHDAVCAQPSNWLCRCEHLCPMRHLDFTRLDACLAGCNSLPVTGHPNSVGPTSVSSDGGPDRSSIPIIVGVIVAFLVILVGVVMLVNREICRKRGHSTRRLLGANGSMGNVFFSAINGAMPISFTNSGSGRGYGGDRLSNGTVVAGNGPGYGGEMGNAFHPDMDNHSVVTINTLDNDEKYYSYQLSQKGHRIEQPSNLMAGGKQHPTAMGEAGFKKQWSSNGAFLKPVVRGANKQPVSSYSLTEFPSPNGMVTATPNKELVYGMPKLAFAGRNKWSHAARVGEMESMTTGGDSSSLVIDDRPSFHHQIAAEDYFSDDEEAFADDEGGVEEDENSEQFRHHDNYSTRLPSTPSTTVPAAAPPLSNGFPVKEGHRSSKAEEIAQSMPTSSGSSEHLSVDQDVDEAFYLDHDRVPLAKQPKTEDQHGSSNFIKRFSKGGGSRLTAAFHTPQLLLTRFSRSEDASKQCEGSGIAGTGNSSQPGALATLRHSQSVTLNTSQQGRPASADTSSSSRPASVASPHRTSAVIQGHQEQVHPQRTALVNGLRCIQPPGLPAVLPVYSDEEKAGTRTATPADPTDRPPPPSIAKEGKSTGYDYVRI